jgi:hypothetical protein
MRALFFVPNWGAQKKKKKKIIFSPVRSLFIIKSFKKSFIVSQQVCLSSSRFIDS